MDLKHPSTKLIIEHAKSRALLRNQVAYVLATAWHETGGYKYMREIWGPTEAQKKYEGRKDLGNTVKGDGKKFLGRGFVQITGRRNYADWSKRLGIDLIKQPQLAEQPDTAARIITEGMDLGTFTGKALDDFITLSKSDFYNARKIVNGLDKAKLIEGYATQFDSLLVDAGYGYEPSRQPDDPGVEKPLPVIPESDKTLMKKTVGAGVVALIVAGFSYIANLPCNWLGLFCGN